MTFFSQFLGTAGFQWKGSFLSLWWEKYLVSFLFRTICTIFDFICEEIYIHKKLEPICKKSIFNKLLHKLTTKCTFSATGKLRKQVDGVSMGGTLSDCFMNKMERDIVLPLKPKFYRRYSLMTPTGEERNMNQMSSMKL